MQTKTTIGLVAAFTAGMALVPMSAKAICLQTFYAERGYSDGTMVQVLGHVNTTDDFAYYAETTNALFSDLIFAAVAQRNRIFVVGNATSCPTTGTLRNIGTVLELYQQP
jgi:hypothetical protein